MRRTLRHAALTATVLGMALSAWALPQRGLAAENQQVATVQQLETEAWSEARAGHFDRTDQLLGKAATISHDPTVEQLAHWSSSFKSQLAGFATERHKQFEELAGQMKLLIKQDKPDYAMDLARTAYLLADDKPAFRGERWVDDLVQQSIKRAQQYDQSEQWIKSMRLYLDLGAIEPSVASWKDHLKLATRRVRLLAMYTPDALKALQESESKEREQVEQLLHPTTQPTTQPAKDASEKAVNETFKIEWRDTLRGVRADMLWEALEDAYKNYYRSVTYRDLAIGGLNGVRAVVTTAGLEKTFPKVGDSDRRAEFVSVIDKAAADAQNAPANKQQEVLREILTKVERVNRETVDIPQEVLVSEFADGAFEKLDTFTSMIWPSDLDEFNKATQGKFSGVGIQIQSDEDGNLKVVSPLEDSPAYKAGIKAEDIITHIDGKNAKGILINQAVRTITGPPGTTVKLTVKSRSGKVRDYVLRRETIHVPSVRGYLRRAGGGWDYLIDPQQRIGYVRITNFTNDTASELNAAIETMKVYHVRGLIMDLRGNPGGLLTAATDVVDKFLDHGVIVSTRPDRMTGNQPTVATAKPDPDDCDLPLVVLVNQYSASASEIVSGALKDDLVDGKPRAIIVGERTFGKGSVQMLFPLVDRSAYLKLTTSHYYLPSGRCIHREENSKEWGVEPDVTVEMTPDQVLAVLNARQDMDVLRDVDPAGVAQPKLSDQPKLADQSKSNEQAKLNDLPTVPSTRPVVANSAKKDLLASDPQLSAALLLMRLEVSNPPVQAASATAAR